MNTDGHAIFNLRQDETSSGPLHLPNSPLRHPIAAETARNQLIMAVQMTDLPNEVLENIIAHLYDGERSPWRTSLLCLKLFHDIALRFQYRSLTMTPVNIACFPLLPRAGFQQHDCAPSHKALQKDDANADGSSSHHSRRPSFDNGFGYSSLQSDQGQPLSHNIRHLNLELPGFACAARLRGFCAAPYTHITIDKTKLYVRHADYVAHLNYCLCSLAAQLPKLKMLKSFRIKAYRGRPYYSCTEDRPFLAENTIIKLMQGLQQCKELQTLEVDLTDAEEIVGSMALEERPCTEHSCYVISQTVTSLPKLRAFKLRKREMCPGCLDFLPTESCHTELDPCNSSPMALKPPNPTLERLTIDLRMPDWQHIASSTYEARVRPCNYICHCLTCISRRSASPSPSPQVQTNNPPQPSPNKTLDKLLSDVFPLADSIHANTNTNTNTADYQPWPTAHQPPPPANATPTPAPAPAPAPTAWLPHYHPATPNIHLHWMVQRNTHPTNPATNTNQPATAQGQAQAAIELSARREQLEEFLQPLLRGTGTSNGVLRGAREVKILVNGNPGAACDNRCRGGVGVDCLRGRVVDLYTGEGKGEQQQQRQGQGQQWQDENEEAVEVDCEGTALRAYMARSRGGYVSA